METTTAAPAATTSTPHGVAVLRDTCPACGNATVVMAESFAEQWAREAHLNVCCGKTEPCTGYTFTYCITHNPW